MPEIRFPRVSALRSAAEAAGGLELVREQLQRAQPRRDLFGAMGFSQGESTAANFSNLETTAGKPALPFVVDLPTPSALEAELAGLSPSQRRTVDAVRANAAAASPAALPELYAGAAKYGYTAQEVDEVLEHFRTNAAMTFFFDPTLRTPEGLTVPASLARDGRYRTRFATGVGNGSMSDDKRIMKERYLFPGGYSENPVIPEERPSYGAFNGEGPQVTGGAKWYGKRDVGAGALIMDPLLNVRTSITHKNSKWLTLEDTGTSDNMAHVLARLLRPATDKDRAFDNRVDYFQNLFDTILKKPDVGRRNPFHYLEGQVHGGEIPLNKYLVAIHADEVFRGTQAERDMQQLADQYEVPLRWIRDGQLVA